MDYILAVLITGYLEWKMIDWDEKEKAKVWAIFHEIAEQARAFSKENIPD